MREEPQVLIVKQVEGSEKMFYKDVGNLNSGSPGYQSEEGRDDEDNIKYCKSNKQPVKSFSELFPPHDDDSESISYIHDDVNDILDRIEDY